VVAVMSRSEDHARAYAIRHGIAHWFTDAQELIDSPEVNAVYVATPPASHATYAIMAMKAGKPVYVEKPLAASYEECLRVNRVAQETGMPCFVAYYRRYLPYFQRVKEIVEQGMIGTVINVHIRFAVPPRELDYAHPENLPWRLQPDIAGGGYFYDLAPHQLDLLQNLFGVIIEARGICANRGGLYKAEDSVSASFLFENGLPGSGSWCFVAHESAREDRIDLIGDRGSVSFSVFDYQPIRLHTIHGEESFAVPNPPYVQFPLIKSVCEHLQGIGICECTSISATPVNWVLDRVLGKF
jgi:predicted dehydrogenase